MSNTYKYGAYGEIAESVNRASVTGGDAPVYIGTAPVHTTAGGAKRVNVPVLVRNFAECVELLGYSDDWDKYTLCEAMYYHFVEAGQGPMVMINVFDPAVHVPADDATATASATPKDNRIVIANADDAILDSVNVTGKVLGTDYTIAYDWQSKAITIVGVSSDSLGAAAINVTYGKVDPTKVAKADVIGATDGEGSNTGVYAVMNVYQELGYVPSLLLAPGWSEIKDVHDAMLNVARGINGHWQAVVYSDIPIVNTGSTQMTLTGAAAWKEQNGYTSEYEKVHFPRVKTRSGKVYHLSVVDCALTQRVDTETEGIPYKTASNTAIDNAQELYFGASKLYVDDDTLNRKLVASGITTAAYVGGQWVMWGANMADYVADKTVRAQASDTARRMLIYLCNRFQTQHAQDVDKPMTRSALQAIAFEEQARLDALVNAGALLYGKAEFVSGSSLSSDLLSGDFKYKFEITTVPLAKSLTAYISWTSEGFQTYISED